MSGLRFYQSLSALFCTIVLVSCGSYKINFAEVFPGIDEDKIEKLLIRKDSHTITDGYTVKREGGSTLYRIKGRYISAGDRFELIDATGNKLMSIRKKIISIRDHYTVRKNSQLYAEIVKTMHPVVDEYILTASDGSKYLVKGDYHERYYSVTNDSGKIAYIESGFSNIFSSYTLLVVSGEDIELMLAVTTVIDRIKEDREKRKKRNNRLNQ